MRKSLSLFAFAVVVVTIGCASSGPPAEEALVYPSAHMSDVTDDYHGTIVADPYRWLEDPDSPESRTWIEAQNELTQDWLGDVKSRKAIERRLTELWDYEKVSAPDLVGGRLFFTRNDGLQNQGVLYTQSSLDGDAELLIDPNTWSDDGTVALAGYYPSKDGNYIAYMIQDGGSDWREARVMNVATGTVLDDHLEWLKFTGLSWTADGSGFY